MSEQWLVCHSPADRRRRTVRGMELLVLVLILLAANGALLLGWGADSREPGYSWDPAHDRR